MENKTEDEPGTTGADFIFKDEIEVLVDNSGVRMWQPKTWRDWVLANKKKTIAFAIVLILLLGTFATSVSLVQSNDKLEKSNTALETKNRELASDVRVAEADLADAKVKIYDCQQSVETAWRAWDRRNQVMVSVLSNLFTSNTTDIEGDNTTAGAEFILAQIDCAPGMDADSIFTNP